MAPIFAVKPDRIAGEQPSHYVGYAARTASKQKMGMIGHQRPSITRCPGFWQNSSQPINEIVFVMIVSEYLSALNTADDDMMQNTGCVQAS
jgi:hypothetical protein